MAQSLKQMVWKVQWLAGNPIAYAYNLDDLYITANVDEKDVADIEKGNDVDVDIDGQKQL